MTEQPNLENISIVLHRPRYPENIGAAVRAGHNMGITNLVVVEPLSYDKTRVLRMATHATADTVDRIQIFDNLKEALSPFNYIVGTTARLGKHRRDVNTPRDMADMILSLSADNRIALLFGPEDRGLTNEDLQFCHSFLNIPTAAFSSINLAQAVMIVCYEIFSAQNRKQDGFSPRLANRHELDGMYDQLKEILTRIGFLNPQNPEYWMNNIRAFFSRLQLRAKEVKIIRGICRQMNWYGEKRYQDGVDENGKKDR